MLIRITNQVNPSSAHALRRKEQEIGKKPCMATTKTNIFGLDIAKYAYKLDEIYS